MVPVLRDAGHDVTGLDSYLFDECRFGPDPAEPSSMRVDVRDVDPADLEPFDAVIHLAALSNDPLGDLAPQYTYEINRDASIRLARLAREAGVERFLFSSSCSIYGAAGGEELVDERAEMAPVTPYAISKVEVEAALRELATDRFSPVYLRNATVYGWSPRLRVDLVLNNLVAWAYLTGEVRVLSDGTPWRPLIHVADLADAFVAALEAPRSVVHDEAFNVGRSGENYQIGELADLAGDVVSGSKVVITGETGSDPRSYRVDFSKIEKSLPAFTPLFGARKGALELRDRYKRHELTMELVDDRFTRLRWLSHLRESGRVGADLRWVNSEELASRA